MKSEFKDRIDAKPEFINLIKQGSKIITLYAKTGVGKSRFVKECFNQITNYDLITVDVVISNKSIVPDMKYADALYEVIKNTQRNSKLNTVNVSFGLSHPLLPVNASVGFNMNMDQRKQTILQGIDDNLSKRTKETYIHFSQAQFMDTGTIQFLRKIMLNYNIKLILEYTLPEELPVDKVHSEISNLISFFSTDDYQTFSLKKLPSKYVPELLVETPTETERTLIINHYEKGHGNIMETILWWQETKYNYSWKDKDILMILMLVKRIQTPISRNLLVAMLSQQNYFPFYGNIEEKVNNAIEILIEREIITEHNNVVTILQSTVFEYFDAKENESSAAMAENIISNYYINRLKSEQDIEASLINLIYVYSLSNDSRANQLISYILKYVYSLSISDSMINKINNILVKNKKTDTNIEYIENLQLELVKILIMSGNQSTAYNILEEFLDLTNPKHAIMYGALICEFDTKLEDTEQQLLSLIQRYRLNPKVKISLQTSLLNYYMRRKSTKIALELSKDILQDKNKQHLEYYYTMKDISIYHNTEDAIKMLTTVITELENRGRMSEADKARITYSSRLIQNGDVIQGKEILESLLTRVNTSHLKIGILHNNLAVIDILNQKSSNKTLVYLKDARQLSGTLYKELLALNNLLIYYVLKDDQINARICARTIEDYSFEQFCFEEFLHLTYLNLLYFYTYIQQNDKIKFYINKLSNLKQTCVSKELKKLISCNLNSILLHENDKWYYLSHFPYRPAFMGYWLINIPTDMSSM